MKNILLAFLAFLLYSSFTNVGKELKWLDWNTGYPLAKKTNKIILVDAYTDWCGWCKKMDRDTYTDTKIIETLNKDFIIVKFNPEIADVEYNLDGVKMSGRELFAQLTQGKSTGFPTTYFIQPNKKQIQVAAGYLGPEDFLKVLDQIVLILK
jgi:uncharacterized protein YyaL (SSP411 family)